jgi:hypothetical protein
MVRRILRLYENKTKQRKIRKILFDIHFTHNSSHSRAPKFAALKPSYPFALPYWGLKGREKEREREREKTSKRHRNCGSKISIIITSALTGKCI